MPVEEDKRVRERFKNEILDTIEKKTKRDDLEDSVIFFKRQ